MSGLTIRGRSLIAAGLACVVSAIALGEEDLVRVGVLLLVLPLAATAMLATTRLQLACHRTLEPRRISAGSLVRVTLRLDNLSRRPTPALFAEDLVLPGSDSTAGAGGDGWASAPHFALDRLGGGATRTMTYSLRPPGRGLYELGPLAVRLCDPFGFCELPRMFQAVDRLLVTPEVVTLPRIDPTGRLTAGITARAGRAGGSGDDDVGTRPYRPGDELRRVHWRTTARIGELSVRREEQPRQGSVTVVLDTRASAWPPGTARGVDAGPAEGGFETAVSVVASITVALAATGTGVRLLSLDGEELGHVPGDRWTASSGVAELLERLARIEAGPVPAGPGKSGRPASPLVLTEDRAVVVLGRVRPADIELLPTSTAGPGLALVVGVDGDVSSLTAAGWVAESVPRLTALPLVWQQLGTGTAQAGGRYLR